MHEERLTERLRSQEREPLRRGGENLNRCIDSILGHLQRILNTRQGNVCIAEDFGVPDFLNFLQSYPESIHHIEDSIRTAIHRYEPRLSGVRVFFIPREEGELTLRFQIVASLARGEDQQVLLETMMDTDGRVCVRR